jgi:Fur family ferric uptake transcriptional regulator
MHTNYCKSFAIIGIIASMQISNPDIRILLKTHGHSITKQRLAIFELLKNKDPLTMNELYGLAKGSLDRASLYRIIAIFEEIGVVTRVNIGWKYKIELSDSFAEHHHHLTCLDCHKIISISEIELETIISQLASTHSFKPIDHQIEMQGYCKDCQNRSI